MRPTELAKHVGVKPACAALEVSRSTLYRRRGPSTGQQQPRPTPARALSETERGEVFDTLCSERFVDRSPAEVVATLLDEEVYAVAFDSNHLVVRDIPYLDSESQLQVGAIVAKLEFIDQERVAQTDHQVFFAGSVPYGLDQKPISNLGGGSTQLTLSAANKT